MTLGRILKSITPQLFALLLVGALWLAAFLGFVPSLTQMSAIVARFLQAGGLEIVALFSFLENIPGVNTYFPGSIVLVSLTFPPE